MASQDLISQAQRTLQADGPLAAYDFLRPFAGGNDDDGAISHELGRIALAAKQPRQALAHLHDAQRLAPERAAIANDVGRAYNNLRDYDAAGAAFARAVALAPDWAEAHLNLGHVQRSCFRYADALVNFLRGRDLGPQSARAHFDVATMLSELGRTKEARDSSRRATELDPNMARAWLLLGQLQQRAGHLEMAVDTLEKALRMTPDDVGALCALASACQSVGDLVSAETHLRAALKLDAHWAPALAALAGVLDLTGRRDDARALLLPATAQASPAPILLIALANMAPSPALADSLLPRLQSVARDPSLGIQTQALLHGAIADLLDAQHEYPLAFRHYARANKLRHSEYDVDELGRYRRRLHELYAVEAPASAATPAFTPIFIVGMPRSGTSLVEQILASHPDIAAAGEQRALALAARAELGPLATLDAQSWRNVSREQLEGIARDYVARMSKHAQGARYCTDKMWQNFEYFWLIKRVFANAPVVHCARHPLDIGLSCFTRSFGVAGPPFANDLEDIGAYYAHYAELIASAQAAPSNPLLTMQYEELVDDLEAQARRLIAFIGLEWDPQCLEFYKLRRVVRTASHGQVTQPVYRTSVARWRHYANELEPLTARLRAHGVNV